jgi:hypothetical protein
MISSFEFAVNPFLRIVFVRRDVVQFFQFSFLLSPHWSSLKFLAMPFALVSYSCTAYEDNPLSLFDPRPGVMTKGQVLNVDKTICFADEHPDCPQK